MYFYGTLKQSLGGYYFTMSIVAISFKCHEHMRSLCLIRHCNKACRVMLGLQLVNVKYLSNELSVPTRPLTALPTYQMFIAFRWTLLTANLVWPKYQ